MIPTKLFFLLFLFSIASCHTKKEVVVLPPVKEVKIAKTVPPDYKPITDPQLANHQDTVYYDGHFFTGYRYSLYADGDTASLQSYFNGVEEGVQRKWYPNKQLAEERFYINGKKEGIHRSWWPDGQQKMYFEAYGDEYSGEFREWYASGLLGKDFHYVNGHEEGSEKLWWDNGTIRANYVIRNGKKYGLLGLKTCINPYDSVIKK
jgi:antitoxin component YwqK of YwqJK toxin-antitoxin module